MLAALSNGHKLGLALVGGAFILFALVASFVLPRRDPNFPGRNLFWFVAASVALFVAMLTAVFVFGKESEEGHAGEPAAHAAKSEGGEAGPNLHVIQIVEKDFSIQAPEGSAQAGTFDIQATNEGKTVHNLVVKGPGVDEHTPDIAPGKEAGIQVELKAGEYELYCSIPGHKAAGMDAKLTVS